MRVSLKDGVLTVIADNGEESNDLLMWHGEFCLELQTVGLAIVEYSQPTIPARDSNGIMEDVG